MPRKYPVGTCPECGRKYEMQGCFECPRCTHEWHEGNEAEFKKELERRLSA